jgi:beta-xylosidase
VNYFKKLFDAFEQRKCTVFRLHMDPCWSNDPDNKTNKWAAAELAMPEVSTGEAVIRYYNDTRFKKYLKGVYMAIAKKALGKGMYVVMRPPGVCPHTIQVGGYYQEYLMNIWDIVSKNSDILKYSGQISLELANEPVKCVNEAGQEDPKALHDFFQPIVDKIRANGYTGIIWIPGTGWQSNYRDYVQYPITGYNIGYAVHDYTGWYDMSDDRYVQMKNAGQDPESHYINSFHNAVPVIDTNPIIITEVDWSPENPNAQGHYNEHGQWVQPNYGTWSTGSTSKWGKAYKALLDHYPCISMTLSSSGCLIDENALWNNNQVVTAFGGLEEACAAACTEWYATFYNENWPHADFTNTIISDQLNGKYANPVVRADFPDPDVIRVDDTYYMVSTTMHLFPGATILKSKDLVNWQYCAQPLTQLSDADRYNLTGGKNAYASGMWACAMTWHNGKFYILINGNDAGGFILSAEDPEGRWNMKKLSRLYYDPGMLFDNGKVYVVSGINEIHMSELDENFNQLSDQVVVTREGSGLEGCHLYKIGDYYYIYATYGGWPSGQVVFRSQNIFGPYEEKMLVEKVIDNSPNTIHQGALVETVNGDWWTILQQDLGALGRFPNLQPVKWEDNWPVVGNKGKPYASYNKPKVDEAQPAVPLPTNDNFRSYPLGMQWEWNHNPDDACWSLLERGGYLRLRPSGTAQNLLQARNTLTQRVFAYSDRASVGTVSIDVSHLTGGNVAGICLLQDPYAMIGLRIKDGQRQIVWQQDTLHRVDNFTPATEVVGNLPADMGDVIYLRASIDYSTSLTRFYYSFDNVSWTPLGQQTKQGFNLSMFVGSRFGLFCYSTEPSQGSYADFDWFSTEDSFDELKFYPAEFEPYSTDMITAVKVESTKLKYEVLPAGEASSILLNATFLDNHTENVAAKATYEMDVPGIVSIEGGKVRGLMEGTVEVKATYVDPMGNEFETTFTVISTCFPFSTAYVNTQLFGQGNSYSATSHTFTPGQNGQMGWVYSQPLDWSGYKYLVVNLSRAQSCQAHLNIYTTNSIWGDCYSSKTISGRQLVVKLQESKLTSGDNKGQLIDLTNICIVSFWGNGNGSIVVKEIYLTNNDDYSQEVPTDIKGVTSVMATPAGQFYDLQGRQVSHAQLKKGLYIINGKKVVVK